MFIILRKLSIPRLYGSDANAKIPGWKKAGTIPALFFYTVEINPDMRGSHSNFLILILLFSGLAAFSVSCRNELPSGAGGRQEDSLHTVYYDDGARLALRTSMANPKQKPSVWLVKDSVSFFLNQLIGINVFVSKNKDRDSLDQVLKIHTFRSPSMYHITLQMDPGIGWIENWNQNPQSDDKKVNELIRDYHLQLIQYIPSGTGAYAVISTAEAVNTYELAKLFVGIKGVRNAAPEISMGEGQDINVTRKNGNYQYAFMKGAGDCPTGCMYKKYWNFSIDKRGRVQYMGTQGHLPPDSLSSMY
jgi:hypothetical protein